MQALPLFQKFPNLSKTIPWIPLGQFPTPVEKLNKLGNFLGLESLWIKRDDLSGELYGGNKVRTLEFILAESKRRQADILFAYSALGSNWPLACVIYGKLNNLVTDVFFLPYPMDDVKRENLELIDKLGRKVIYAKSKATFPFVLYWHLLKAKKNQNVHLTPPGGVSATTTLGFVNAILELKAQQEHDGFPIPDYILCPFGSGGTAAGISIGLTLVGWQTKVIAVRIVDFIVANKLTLNRLIRKTVKLMQQKGINTSKFKNWGQNVQVEHHYFGSGYSKPTALGQKSIDLFKQYEGQLLDSTYTGKTFAPLIDWANKEEFRNKHILFWQTLNSRNLKNIPAALALNT